VLARAATDDENSHCVKGLRASQRLHVSPRDGEYFVDAARS
jgi:hypothetical protein